MENSIKVFAPASIGNVIVGFDVLGLAVKAPGDEIILRKTENTGQVRILKIEGDNGKLSKEVLKNTAGIAVQSMLRNLNSNQGIDILLYKKLPLGSGLGSSAASAVAAVHACNELLGSPLSKTELLPFLLEAETYASGTGHLDNAAPCLLGGLVLVKSINPIEVKNLPYPKDLKVVLIKPKIEILTKQARMLLRGQVEINNAVKQLSNLASFVSSVYENDVDEMRKSLKDHIAEPIRAQMIPGFDMIKQIALEENAIGCGISGSGPTIFSLCETKKQAEAILEKQIKYFNEINMDSFGSVTEICDTGAKVVG